MSNLSIAEKAALLRSIAEDIQGNERIEELLEKKPNFRAYNGFEPSGRMHIAQALVTAINCNAITKAGGTMVLYIADLFAQLNHKMGGDMKKIHDVGRYFVEVFKACGMDLDHVEIIWTADFIKEHQREYFELVHDISSFATLSRIKRTVTAMGRTEGDKLSLSQLLYPCMQATDVFMLDVDICQLGVDQRKVNMLAIEYANHVKRPSPIILSHHMLMGLKGKAHKMSKSDPMSAIFIEDEKDRIVEKMMNAYNPPEAAENPLFEYIKYIILRKLGSITINGKEYTKIEDVEADFPSFFKDDEAKKGLVMAVAEAVDACIQPVRDHFKSSPELIELLKRVEEYRVTR
ncbi:hypothetical protein TVAG_263250 [Trichomonas vaginalis G3]|uniref:tyrosine--tRNA ligase n=1 Tax=Trichomonas vaginalis (strain ATCC PRA-98 / G3) TaxID=412133 RepID=A2FA72_TRIV3|nr:tyrosine-tRNA ligase protein [Trichomonas vaginalis G3]EAX98208.1 hypothetical protein TVAG_263250 [Trichomonas vaginalis G3]KAI5533986.1 tyrosine-tRNA ligase protein [Trichomonas vaginalis G3]|eukprot:XP_001311138.1 hypothetical protein [Trichomonas vaginalis G3]